MIKYKQYTLDGAFRYIKNLRGKILPNIGFMMQLREFEKEVLNNNKDNNNKDINNKDMNDDKNGSKLPLNKENINNK